MGMKDVEHEPHGEIKNCVTQAHKVDYLSGKHLVRNAGTWQGCQPSGRGLNPQSRVINESVPAPKKAEGTSSATVPPEDGTGY